MKYNIGPPEVFHGDSNYIFFVEISAIIAKMDVISTIHKNGVVDHMNVVEVPTAQVDQFELICEKHNIQFKAV